MASCTWILFLVCLITLSIADNQVSSIQFVFLFTVDEDDVFSFIQISDTHLSHLPTSMTHINFRIFTSTVVPAFNPDIVILTGDITDGWIEGLKSTSR